ncbi:MAG: acetoacetate--CoA ligase [Magnetovibrionaceae bacterium]
MNTDADPETGAILWQPDAARIAASNMTAFREAMESRWQTKIADVDALWQWSVENREMFWLGLAEWAGLKAETWGETALVNGDIMPKQDAEGLPTGAKWFPGARLNYAENMLVRRDEADALVFWGEDKVKRRLSWKGLYDTVSRVSAALRGLGVGPGDRVAGFMPNMPETVIAMLATATIGATWSSCSPDFGAEGVLDRFGQIAPKVLFGVTGYHYNGKVHDCREKLATLADRLPGLERLVAVPYAVDAEEPEDWPNRVPWVSFTGLIADEPPCEITFEQLPFDHPLFILFSSGTTGKPKCIVHGAGGTLIQHIKEHRLHSDLRPDDRLFYFTTCGWMMWNWLVSGLGSGATLLLYDGSPFYPDHNILFDLADAEGMTFFGTSAKYIDALAKAEARPMDSHSLSGLRTLASTGSPLSPASFDYVYQAIKTDLQLASIAGGTDIVSCFVLGNPAGPVRRGEIQMRGLGMAVDVFDGEGQPIRGQKGELVCTRAFPSQPVAFWDDANGARYRKAYFERFDNVWHHGDYVSLTDTGGTIIYGRSDATLNPGGVRIGTAEIYRQVETLETIKEALVVGQDWQDDVRVVLFVVLADDVVLDEALIKTIKDRIRTGCTPRHVPAKVLAVPDLPRTKSGKITELAVRDIIHGREIANVTALANAEVLEAFKNLPALYE